MPTPRILLSTFGACAVFLLTAYIHSDSQRDVVGADCREGGESHHR